MRNHLLLFFTLFTSLSSIAQYNDPYRIAYDGNSYYVTNKGNGTVSKLDASGSITTAISGLHSPNDIFYGSIAGNSVILILDSNMIKIYDSASLGGLLNLDITDAVEAHDGVFNPNNTNEFFISDRGDNKIIKGTIGSAPFYPITYSTFATGIIKPAGITINSSGKLIVVSDTVAGKIYEIDLVNGNKNVALNGTKNYLNDVAQDAQGNYYVTNWGDDKLYRYDRFWNNETEVGAYSDPSGLYTNITDGVLGVASYGSQQVSFSPFHLFAPSENITVCPGDSVIVTFDTTQSGIGTYTVANEFLVQMSDSNGSFANPILLGSKFGTSAPDTIRCAIPEGTYANNGYLYRIRSTSPVKSSSLTKSVTINPNPDASLVQGSVIYGCQGSIVKFDHQPYDGNIVTSVGGTGSFAEFLGREGTTYSFLSNVDSIYSYWNSASNVITGCESTYPFTIDIGQNLQLTLEDTLTICEGDSILLGNNPDHYKYTWQGSSSINDASAPSPLFYGTNNTMMQVALEDSTQVCTGMDSVFVKVKPELDLSLGGQVTSCEGDSIQLGIENAPYVFNWQPAYEFSDFTSPNPQYGGDAYQRIYVSYSDSLKHCTTEEVLYVQTGKKPKLSFFLQELEFCTGDTIFRDYTWGDSINFTYVNNDQTPLTSGGWLADSVGRYRYELIYSYTSTGCSNVFGNGYGVHYRDDSVRITNEGSYLDGTVYGQSGNQTWWFINGESSITGDTLNTDRLEDGDSVFAMSINNSHCRVFSNTIIWETLGVENQFTEFSIFPNPSNGRFTVESSSPISSIEISDISGRLLISRVDGDWNFELPNGFYYVTVYTSEGIGRRKIVVTD